MDTIRKEIKRAFEFSKAEKLAIINEYLTTDLTKTQVWRKHTGYKHERGGLLRWMRQFGYTDKLNINRIFRPELITELNRSKDKNNPTKEELLIRLKKLEKELEEAKVKSEGYQLMIEIAEKELKIPIRKKSGTK